MEVNWYNDKVVKRNRYYYSSPKRQFLDVAFTGDTAIDRIKIQSGQVYIKEMLNNKDTIHGIDFHFSEHSRYATFVAVLDICNMEDAKTYACSDDGVKFFYINHAHYNKVRPLRFR